LHNRAGCRRTGNWCFDYNTFPTFLKGIQKPNAIRDLYINTTGAEAHHGKPFANGSILVMEIYKTKKGANDELEKDGNLIKDGLAKVYVMQKRQKLGHACTRRPEKCGLDLFGIQAQWG
jgi:cytochrome P460